MRTKPGAVYCGEHRGFGSNDSRTDRVPCPYDPNQYINIHEKQLAKHCRYRSLGKASEKMQQETESRPHVLLTRHEYE